MRVAGVSIVESNGIITISPNFLQGDAPKNVAMIIRNILNSEPEAAYRVSDTSESVFKFGKHIVYFDDPDVRIEIGAIPPKVEALADQVAILGNLKAKFKLLVSAMNDEFSNDLETEEDESPNATSNDPAQTTVEDELYKTESEKF